MLGRIVSFVLVSLTLVTSAAAQDTHQLGHGRLFVNDLIGDGKDRWRTGSIASSYVFGQDWQGAAPSEFGGILEFRILGEIIAPEDIVTPAAGDRPWAGALSGGVHTHWMSQGLDLSLGGDIVVLGPQTQLDHIQTGLHKLLGTPPPSNATLNAQIGNKVRPSMTFEAAKDWAVGSQTEVRPFAEFRAGVETFARVGFDLTFGDVGTADLLVRDPVTGHRYRTIKRASQGFSWIVGADIAKVYDSAYLPEDRGYALSDARSRVRAGVHWQGEKSAVFYGLTWLSKEFVGQRDEQVVGALRLDLQF